MKYVLVPSAKKGEYQTTNYVFIPLNRKKSFSFFMEQFVLSQSVKYVLTSPKLLPCHLFFFFPPTEINFLIKKTKIKRKKPQTNAMKTSIHHRSWAKLDAVGGSCKGDRVQKSRQVSEAASSKHKSGPYWYRRTSSCMRGPSWPSSQLSSSAKKMMHTGDENQDKVKMSYTGKVSRPTIQGWG